MKLADYTTADPPCLIDDLLLREYIYGLRRRIEVQNCLMESLVKDNERLTAERNGLADQIDAVLIDLHWYKTRRNMEPC
jgi:hypothetical protein